MLRSYLFKALLICGTPVGSVFFVTAASAQNSQKPRSTSEVGLGVGGLVYRGELAESYQLRNNRPAITGFYRKDISAPITLRGGLTYGMIRADDRNQKQDDNILPLANYRQASLKGGLLEGSAVIEYNFFDYHNRRDKVHFTPYLFIGIAGFYANTRASVPEGSNAAGALLVNGWRQNPQNNNAIEQRGGMLGFAIPAGVGVKYALSQHWNLGAEVGARKAFTDNLDHFSKKDIATSDANQDLLFNRHNQDWYFYNGISISYTFYKINCPE